MKKILIINGSPKAKSDTMVLTTAFLQGLTENGLYEVEIIDVIKHEIRPCLGCFECMKKCDKKCVQQDFQNELLLKIEAADILLYSFPLYCYSMPSHLKAVIDRLLPLTSMKMTEQNGRVVHVPLVDFSKKQTIVISGCGFPDWKNNFAALRIMCQNIFRNNLTAVFVPEAPMLNAPEAAPVVQPLLEKFRNAGREYASKQFLSEETVTSLEAPMIPGEVYISIVNGN